MPTATINGKLAIAIINQGRRGPPGEPGSGGGGGSGDPPFIHVQSVPSATWTINHNRGVFQQVTLLSLAGEQFNSQVDQPTVNQVVVTNLTARTGRAICTN